MHRSIPALTWTALAAWLALAGPPAARAEESRALCPLCTHAQSSTAPYHEKAGYTLARGTANALLGWTELIAQPASEVKQGGNLLVGIGKGIGQGIVRTFGGAAEVLTFWTPKMQNQEYLHFAEDCPLCMKRGGAASTAAATP